MKGDLSALEAVIGHTFRDRELLERALTHKSHAHEQAGDLAGAPHDTSGDNEQLEFLGDAVLGFVASEYLVRHNPDAPEGRLSKLKAHLVSAAHLHEAAQALGLGEFLFLGRGEEMSGGREKKALLADALEAIIAAIYLDSGADPARCFIETHVLGAFRLTEDGAGSAATDHKSALQEMAQALKLPPPRYVIVAEDGPEHVKTFTVEVRVGKDWVSQAQGSSKKSAGQRAAQQVLQQLTEWGR
ncbi:MAG: ribonuclease III [Acidobacteriota bacterium]